MEEGRVKLTAKQELFCNEYLIDLNATQAAIRAGYSVDTAKQMGCENLAKPYLNEYIVELKAIRLKKCEISQENVLKELAKIGFADIRNFYDNEGNLRKPHELDDNSAAALASIDIDEIKEYNRDTGTRDVVGITKKIKLHGKVSALDLLGKHLGVFEKDNKQKSTEGLILKINEVITDNVRGNIQDNSSSE